MLPISCIPAFVFEINNYCVALKCLTVNFAYNRMRLKKLLG